MKILHIAIILVAIILDNLPIFSSRFFASQEDGLVGQMRWDFCGPFISSCKRLLSVLLTAEPRVRRLLSERKKALQRAIEGLGQHGMVRSMRIMMILLVRSMLVIMMMRLKLSVTRA